MNVTKMSKLELLEKCKELGIKKYKTKKKDELIDLINNHNLKKTTEIMIEDDLDDNDDFCDSEKKNTSITESVEKEDELQSLYNELINNTPSQEINKIFNDDCITTLKMYNDKIVTLTILDPPYYKVVNEKWDHSWKNEIDYLAWFEQVVVEVSRVSKNNSALYLFGYWRMLYKQIPILEKYGVDLVLCGHDHNYQRHVKNGIQYIVTGLVMASSSFCRTLISLVSFSLTSLRRSTLLRNRHIS